MSEARKSLFSTISPLYQLFRRVRETIIKRVNTGTRTKGVLYKDTFHKVFVDYTKENIGCPDPAKQGTESAAPPPSDGVVPLLKTTASGTEHLTHTWAQGDKVGMYIPAVGAEEEKIFVAVGTITSKIPRFFCDHHKCTRPEHERTARHYLLQADFMHSFVFSQVSGPMCGL